MTKSPPLFTPPYGSGPDETIAKLVVQSANQTFPFIVPFIEIINNEPFGESTPITVKRCLNCAGGFPLQLNPAWYIA
jgi:hypothetical protein